MLRRLGLGRFKSFQKAVLEFGNLTLIVGANASGKSNLRDALRFLHGVGLGYSLAEIIGGKYGPGGIEQWKGIRGGPKEIAFHGATRFALSADIVHGRRKLRYRLEVNLADERLGPRVVRESLRTRDDYWFDSHPYDSPLSEGREHVISVRCRNEGRGRRPHLEFPSHSPVISQIPHRPKLYAALRKACEDALGVLEGMRFLDLDPDAMRESSPPGLTILGDRGENLSSVLQEICEDKPRKQQLLSWVRSLTPMDAVDFDFKLDLQGRTLVYLVEGSGQSTSAVSASDGTLRFLALVAALLGSDSGRIYFFEEFDNGIHPTRLHLLLNLVQQACRQQGVQVVGTTHNPALLAFLEPGVRKDAVLAYRPEGEVDTRVRRIVDLPDVERILASQDLGRLHASGWMEDAAVFSEPDEEAAP